MRLRFLIKIYMRLQVIMKNTWQSIHEELPAFQHLRHFISSCNDKWKLLSSALCLPRWVPLSLKCLSWCAAQRVLLCVLLVPASEYRHGCTSVCWRGVSVKGGVGQRSMSMSFLITLPLLRESPTEPESHDQAR